MSNQVFGIISDTQFPGHVDNSLEFVLDIGNDWGVTDWIHVGDMFDHHYMSRHPNELDALNPIQEFQSAYHEVQQWVKAIPKLKVCLGNHDMIPERQAQTLGIPPKFLKSLNSIYDLPDTWVWAEQWRIFEDTLVEHGLGSGGMYGAKNTANKLGCSYIQGHTHAHAAVFDIPRVFKSSAAMNVGCLMDIDKYHARYGKQVFKVSMSLGIGIATSDDTMYFERMR